ncbi:MAG: tRNA (adenosine(37)-N6)-threonylcarbamoyltransferase complex ATPase subunit type 1 TsaE [Gammaproteobacteria bacterium]|nr:tRNA (adenosine(37)-N6)-threonylcarbamoyltransferase complex ATPase subunit type 1 TsaE [Gammaproteobacteria bacterium]
MAIEYLPDTGEQMEDLGADLAKRISAPAVIFLQGELGAGKTTLVRGFLHGRGYQGAVKSPTYTLIESYLCGDVTCYHLDLYRLNDPEELDYLGLRDIFTEKTVCLIEWPERFVSVLPLPSHKIAIEYRQSGRSVRVETT